MGKKRKKNLVAENDEIQSESLDLSQDEIVEPEIEIAPEVEKPKGKILKKFHKFQRGLK